MRRLNACGKMYPHIPGQEAGCADHAKRKVPVDRVLAQIDAISAHPELPLDLLDHLHGHAAYILRLCSLFGDESGHACMCLGVNRLALAPILLANLLLGRLSLVGALSTTVVVSPSSSSSSGAAA